MIIERFDGIDIKCDITNSLVGVKYLTSRHPYVCYKCKGRINAKEDYYYTVVDTTLKIIDVKEIPEGMTIFLPKKKERRSFHTECMPNRKNYLWMEAKKAKQHFKKL